MLCFWLNVIMGCTIVRRTFCLRPLATLLLCLHLGVRLNLAPRIAACLCTAAFFLDFLFSLTCLCNVAPSSAGVPLQRRALPVTLVWVTPLPSPRRLGRVGAGDVTEGGILMVPSHQSLEPKRLRMVGSHNTSYTIDCKNGFESPLNLNCKKN